jgi:hypothetical protein
LRARNRAWYASSCNERSASGPACAHRGARPLVTVPHRALPSRGRPMRERTGQGHRAVAVLHDPPRPGARACGGRAFATGRKAGARGARGRTDRRSGAAGVARARSGRRGLAGSPACPGPGAADCGPTYVASRASRPPPFPGRFGPVRGGRRRWGSRSSSRIWYTSGPGRGSGIPAASTTRDSRGFPALIRVGDNICVTVQ